MIILIKVSSCVSRLGSLKSVLSLIYLRTKANENVFVMLADSRTVCSTVHWVSYRHQCECPAHVQTAPPFTAKPKSWESSWCLPLPRLTNIQSVHWQAVSSPSNLSTFPINQTDLEFRVHVDKQEQVLNLDFTRFSIIRTIKKTVWQKTVELK